MQYTKHILSFVLVIFSIWGCSNSESKNAPLKQQKTGANGNGILTVTKSQFEKNDMKIGTIGQQEFLSVVQTTGMIDVPPQNRAVISAYTGGYIKNTPLLIGDKIKKGQPLVTIENPDFISMQQEYLEVVQQLSFLKSEHDRQKALVAEKITSQKNFLKAESEYKRTLAMYKGFRKKLNMLNINPLSVENGNITSLVTIYSPISGSITRVNVNKGVYVSPADEILEIVNTDHIHLELSVFEKDIMKLKKGQTILFKIPEASKTTFKAAVHLVGTSIDKKNRTVKVHGHLTEGFKHNFATGMFIEAQIIVDKIVAKALPKEVIVSVDRKSYVLMLDTNSNADYVFIKKEVSIDNISNEYISITDWNQFKETDRFLVKGAFNLIDEK